MSENEKKLPEIVEIKFKNNRREYYLNPKNVNIYIDNYVIVEAERGYDLGKVNYKGRLFDPATYKKPLLNIIRNAKMQEIEKLSELREKEHQILLKIKKHIKNKEIPMKLVDVEYQFDGNKLTFYFTADHRIDFRELVRELASMYRTRIEMRQIGVRDEAQKLGSYGICGRPLCCVQFLRKFETISTDIVKEQHLSLNPIKISGICGRLMCCLLYEHEIYKEALKEYPPIGAKIEINKIVGEVQEINIFRKTLTIQAETGEKHIIEVNNLPENEYQKLLKIAENYHKRGLNANIIEESLIDENGQPILGDEILDETTESEESNKNSTEIN